MTDDDVKIMVVHAMQCQVVSSSGGIPDECDVLMKHLRCTSEQRRATLSKIASRQQKQQWALTYIRMSALQNV